VGAPVYDHDDGNDGAAFVYHGSPQGLDGAPADWSAGGGQKGSQFGFAASAAGDFNHDGYADVIIGAYNYNKSDVEVKAGAVFIFYGSFSGLSSSPDWTVIGPHKNAQFGYSVGAAGDVNGDGIDDVIVGAPQYTIDPADPAYEGAIYLFYGAESEEPSTTAAWSYESDQAYARLGTAVAGAGDVNGDGVDDIIAGLPNYNGEAADMGAAILFLGSDSGLADSPDWTVEGEQAGSDFGAAVAGVGDVNGDGMDEVAVGAPGLDRDEDETSVGGAYLYHGSDSGPATVANWTTSQGGAGALFGHSVGGAGDINGDSYADLVVGAPGWEVQQVEGAIFVFLGSSTGLSSNPVWRGAGDKARAGFGFASGSAGDVNKDGFDDIVTGAPNYRHSDIRVGGAFVYHGAEGFDYDHSIYLPLVMTGAVE
jgi:hypothetical protein